MASPVEKELAKQLECGICLEKFEEPKMLTCQHSYCKKCLERLVTRNEITCPVCRKKTQVPSSDVNSLPSNFLINSLQSIRGNGQSNASTSPPCEKHDGEVLKLFCRDCDQLICRDCTVIDHRDHDYTFVKVIFPAVKEKILGIVKKSRSNLIVLESSIETIKEQEGNMHKNSVDVKRELNSFIDNQIELLERKRQSLTDNLQKSVTTQKKILDAQMDYFQTSLGCLKRSVEFTERALAQGSEVEIISARDQMIKQLTELNSATLHLTPREKIYCGLKVDNDAAMSEMVTIREYDKEYQVKKHSKYGKLAISVRPKNESIKFDPANEVQVKVYKSPINTVLEPDISKNRDGSFSCSFRLFEFETYTIEVIVNGRYVDGSPFNLEDIPNERLLKWYDMFSF